MKSTLILFLLAISHCFSQINPNTLLGLPQLSTTDRLSVTPTQGNLVFDTDLKKVFEFNGTEWKQLLEDRENAVVVPLTTNYTLLLTNNTNVLTFNSTSDITLTVPVGLPIGYNVSIYQIGAGQVTIVGAGGVQIKNRLLRFKTAGLDAGVGLIATATNIFHATGDLKR